MFFGKSNKEILAELDSKVAGHLQVKKHLINLVNRQRIRQYQTEIYCETNKSNLVDLSRLLILGPSGTGKTYLVQSLQEILDLHVYYISATNLNPTGASGGIKALDLAKNIKESAKDFVEERPHLDRDEVLNNTIIFVDEVDKLAKKFCSNGTWNEHVQSNFLSIFSGEGDFNKYSIIFAGAFTDIVARKYEKGLGFKGELLTTIDKKAVCDEDLIQYGLIPEFVGRISAIVQLDYFTVEDYKRVLKTMLLPKIQHQLKMLNVISNSIKLTEEKCEEIANKAYNSGMGIRALRRELEKEYIDLEFDSDIIFKKLDKTI